MDDRPYVLIAALLGALALAIAAAWYFGGSQRGPIAGSTATETFRARPGTQRDNARALISSREHASKDGTRTDPVEVWGRFDDGQRPDSGGDDSEESLRLAEEVTDDLSPEDGLAVLNVELQRTNAPSALYTAMGTLYARQKPYDEQRVEDAFALALSTAKTSEERLNVIYRHARVHLERGRADAVLELLNRTRPEGIAFDARAAEIEIIRANAQWEAGDAPGSIATLEALLNRSEIDAFFGDAEFRSVYRQAAARLIRIYKESGEPDKAEAAGRKLRSRLRD